MKPKSNPFLRYSLAIAASSAFLSMGSAQAATYDWDGDTNSNFTNGANWVGGSWAQWSDYTFGSNATSGTVNINGEFGMNSLTLASGLTHDIVIGSDVSQPFIMGVGVAGNPSALISIDTASKNLTINSQYIAASAVTWDVGANRTLTLNGQFNNWFNPASLVKNGAGTAVLTNNNGYTGDTTINGGTLNIGNGGTTGSLYSPSVSSGNLTFGSSGAIVNNAALVYNIAGGSANVNKTISGTGTVSVTGDQSVNFAAGAAITTNGSQTYSATATGGRYYGFNLADDATVTLTSTAGDISMTGMLGTANGNTGNLIINTSAGNGSVTLNTPAGVSGVDYGLNALTVNAGTGAITLGTHNAQNWNHVTTISLTGGVINSSANLTDFTTLGVTNTGASVFSGNLTASGGALIKDGSGTLTLTGGNSYAGGTTINGGALKANRDTLGTGAVVINNGGTLYVNDQWVLCGANQYGVAAGNIGTLTINSGGTLELDATNGFANGATNLYLYGGAVIGGNSSDGRGALYLWNGNEQITAGDRITATTSTISANIGLTGNNNTITVNSASTLNITVGITNSSWAGGGGIIKAGDGTLTLAAANSYTGTTVVTGGTLKVTGNNYLPGNGGITVGLNATLMTDAANDANTQSITSMITLNGGTLAAGTGTSANNGHGPYGNYFLGNGASIQAGGSTTSTISASLGLGTGEKQITVGGGSTLNISGDIFGVSYVAYGQFSKSGDGTLVLSGNNKAASQGMILSAGTVEFSNNSLPTNIRASGGPAGYSADIQGNATLRWASGNTQDISYENGSSQVKIGDGVTATFDTNGNNVTLGTAFDLGASKTGALTKTGTGTLTLSAANSYTGATIVNNGTLIVSGNISTSSMTTVQTGASLGGSGTVGSLTVNSGAFLNPGNSPGILSVDGDYTQAGTLTMEITGLIAGNQHDQLNVDRVSGDGSVSLSGSLVAAFSGGSYANGNLIFILLNDASDAISGTFSGFAQDAIVTHYGGFDWKISYTADSTGNTFTGGNDVALMAVPEPGAVLLGGLGMLALLRRRRA